LANGGDLIPQVDNQLTRWVEKTLGAITISLLPPEKAPKGQGISLYLLSLAENPPLQGFQRAPLQFRLCYLVTAWAQDPLQAHAILGELLLAAMDTPEYEVELDNIHPTIWAGFGIPPRPAFILRVPVRKERPQGPVQLVREPLHVKWIEPVRLSGTLYGPEDSPLSGVRVALMPEAGDNPLNLEYARLCPSTVTENQGLFTFVAVPPQPRYTLFIHFKDQELFAGLDRPIPDNTPLILRWGLLALQVTGSDGQPAASSLVRFSLEGSTANGVRLVCEAGEEPLRSLRLEYPTLQLAAHLNSEGQGYLLLQEKALGQASKWLKELRGQLLSADQQPLVNAKIVCPSLNLSATTDDQGAFTLK
jgi:hypothetical protein